MASLTTTQSFEEYLSKHFDDTPLPAEKEQLKNGHVLQLYVKSGKSYPRTVERVKKEWDYNIKYSQVRSLVKKTLKYYKNPSRTADFLRFSEVSKFFIYFHLQISLPKYETSLYNQSQYHILYFEPCSFAFITENSFAASSVIEPEDCNFSIFGSIVVSLRKMRTLA